MIREFQRLKEQEQKQMGWSAKRELAKLNYHIDKKDPALLLEAFKQLRRAVRSSGNIKLKMGSGKDSYENW